MAQTEQDSRRISIAPLQAEFTFSGAEVDSEGDSPVGSPAVMQIQRRKSKMVQLMRRRQSRDERREAQEQVGPPGGGSGGGDEDGGTQGGGDATVPDENCSTSVASSESGVNFSDFDEYSSFIVPGSAHGSYRGAQVDLTGSLRKSRVAFLENLFAHLPQDNPGAQPIKPLNSDLRKIFEKRDKAKVRGEIFRITHEGKSEKSKQTANLIMTVAGRLERLQQQIAVLEKAISDGKKYSGEHHAQLTLDSLRLTQERDEEQRKLDVLLARKNELEERSEEIYKESKVLSKSNRRMAAEAERTDAVLKDLYLQLDLMSAKQKNADRQLHKTLDVEIKEGREYAKTVDQVITVRQKLVEKHKAIWELQDEIEVLKSEVKEARAAAAKKLPPVSCINVNCVSLHKELKRVREETEKLRKERETLLEHKRAMATIYANYVTPAHSTGGSSTMGESVAAQKQPSGAARERRPSRRVSHVRERSGSMSPNPTSLHASSSRSVNASGMYAPDFNPANNASMALSATSSSMLAPR